MSAEQSPDSECSGNPYAKTIEEINGAFRLLSTRLVAAALATADASDQLQRLQRLRELNPDTDTGQG